MSAGANSGSGSLRGPKSSGVLHPLNHNSPVPGFPLDLGFLGDIVKAPSATPCDGSLPARSKQSFASVQKHQTGPENQTQAPVAPAPLQAELQKSAENARALRRASVRRSSLPGDFCTNLDEEGLLDEEDFVFAQLHTTATRHEVANTKSNADTFVFPEDSTSFNPGFGGPFPSTSTPQDTSKPQGGRRDSIPWDKTFLDQNAESLFDNDDGDDYVASSQEVAEAQTTELPPLDLSFLPQLTAPVKFIAPPSAPNNGHSCSGEQEEDSESDEACDFTSQPRGTAVGGLYPTPSSGGPSSGPFGTQRSGQSSGQGLGWASRSTDGFSAPPDSGVKRLVFSSVELGGPSPFGSKIPSPEVQSLPKVFGCSPVTSKCSLSPKEELPTRSSPDLSKKMAGHSGSKLKTPIEQSLLTGSKAEAESSGLPLAGFEQPSVGEKQHQVDLAHDGLRPPVATIIAKFELECGLGVRSLSGNSGLVVENQSSNLVTDVEKLATSQGSSTKPLAGSQNLSFSPQLHVKEDVQASSQQLQSEDEKKMGIHADGGGSSEVGANIKHTQQALSNQRGRLVEEDSNPTCEGGDSQQHGATLTVAPSDGEDGGGIVEVTSGVPVQAPGVDGIGYKKILGPSGLANLKGVAKVEGGSKQAGAVGAITGRLSKAARGPVASTTGSMIPKKGFAFSGAAAGGGSRGFGTGSSRSSVQQLPHLKTSNPISAPRVAATQASTGSRAAAVKPITSRQSVQSEPSGRVSRGSSGSTVSHSRTSSHSHSSAPFRFSAGDGGTADQKVAPARRPARVTSDRRPSAPKPPFSRDPTSRQLQPPVRPAAGPVAKTVSSVKETGLVKKSANGVVGIAAGGAGAGASGAGTNTAASSRASAAASTRRSTTSITSSRASAAPCPPGPSLASSFSSAAGHTSTGTSRQIPSALPGPLARRISEKEADGIITRSALPPKPAAFGAKALPTRIPGVRASGPTRGDRPTQHQSGLQAPRPTLGKRPSSEKDKVVGGLSTGRPGVAASVKQGENGNRAAGVGVKTHLPADPCQLQERQRVSEGKASGHCDNTEADAGAYSHDAAASLSTAAESGPICKESGGSSLSPGLAAVRAMGAALASGSAGQKSTLTEKSSFSEPNHSPCAPYTGAPGLQASPRLQSVAVESEGPELQVKDSHPEVQPASSEATVPIAAAYVQEIQPQASASYPPAQSASQTCQSGLLHGTSEVAASAASTGGVEVTGAPRTHSASAVLTLPAVPAHDSVSTPTGAPQLAPSPNLQSATAESEGNAVVSSSHTSEAPFTCAEMAVPVAPASEQGHQPQASFSSPPASSPLPTCQAQTGLIVCASPIKLHAAAAGDLSLALSSSAPMEAAPAPAAPLSPALSAATSVCVPGCPAAAASTSAADSAVLGVVAAHEAAEKLVVASSAPASSAATPAPAASARPMIAQLTTDLHHASDGEGIAAADTVVGDLASALSQPASPPAPAATATPASPVFPSPDSAAAAVSPTRAALALAAGKAEPATPVYPVKEGAPADLLHHTEFQSSEAIAAAQIHGSAVIQAFAGQSSLAGTFEGVHTMQSIPHHTFQSGAPPIPASSAQPVPPVAEQAADAMSSINRLSPKNLTPMGPEAAGIAWDADEVAKDVGNLITQLFAVDLSLDSQFTHGLSVAGEASSGRTPTFTPASSPACKGILMVERNGEAQGAGEAAAHPSISQNKVGSWSPGSSAGQQSLIHEPLVAATRPAVSSAASSCLTPVSKPPCPLSPGEVASFSSPRPTPPQPLAVPSKGSMSQGSSPVTSPTSLRPLKTNVSKSFGSDGGAMTVPAGKGKKQEAEVQHGGQDDWLQRVLEAEALGEEALTRKSGRVMNSPMPGLKPKPGPYSPVRKHNYVGPFDCTKRAAFGEDL